ncbi:MAG: hypothetical protein JWN41_1802 [Thermoleophilia bacterium]|nr:hypothetical protein [Thermoleophilia bacterium]
MVPAPSQIHLIVRSNLKTPLDRSGKPSYNRVAIPHVRQWEPIERHPTRPHPTELRVAANHLGIEDGRPDPVRSDSIDAVSHNLAHSLTGEFSHPQPTCWPGATVVGDWSRRQCTTWRERAGASVGVWWRYQLVAAARNTVDRRSLPCTTDRFTALAVGGGLAPFAIAEICEGRHDVTPFVQRNRHRRQAGTATPRASATSRATAVGFSPTRTPAASSASTLLLAVPELPLMIAPACPICLPSGATRPAI